MAAALDNTVLYESKVLIQVTGHGELMMGLKLESDMIASVLEK